MRFRRNGGGSSRSLRVTSAVGQRRFLRLLFFFLVAFFLHSVARLLTSNEMGGEAEFGETERNPLGWKRTRSGPTTEVTRYVFDGCHLLLR